MKKIKISVLHYGFPAGNAVSIKARAVVWMGGSAGRSAESIKAYWQRLENSAHTFQYAEQSLGSTSAFPKSVYPFYGFNGNNSNTFIRHIVSEAGLTMLELGGTHPGNMTWDTNAPEYYYYENIDQISNKPN